MGEVYRAHDSKLDRDVAIKILPDLLAADPERIARFDREAKVLATLNHPHIAHIYGVEDSDGVRALVMELVEGPTLADRIAQGPIPLDEALPIARQIAEALEAAHEQGIVHRDLKPANIKIRGDGVVKVLDFGLAKLTQAEPDAGAMNLSQSPTITSPAMMTGAAVLLGTAAYMSPEQAKGRAADKRSDIWAFGCVLYEMLTGKRAFDGEDVSDTLANVFKTPPDWSALPANIPMPVRALATNCLEKDRNRRVADISTALFILGNPTLTTDGPIMELPRREWPARPALVLSVAVILTSTLSSLAWWSFRPASPQPIIARYAIALAEGQQFSGTANVVVAISPDGTRIAYIANRRLYVRSMAELDARPVPGTESLEDVMAPAFSPDGRSIAFWSSSALRKIPVTGGTPATLCQADRPPMA